MNNDARLMGLVLPAGFLLVSCSLPTFLAVQLQEVLTQSLPSQEPAREVPRAETVEPSPEFTLQEYNIRVADQALFEESESPRYAIDGVWPNLIGPEAVIAPFNSESDRLVQNTRESFLAAVNESAVDPGGQGQALVSTLRLTYELTYSDQRLFSFLITFDQYIAVSVHPFPFSHALN